MNHEPVMLSEVLDIHRNILDGTLGLEGCYETMHIKAGRL